MKLIKLMKRSVDTKITRVNILIASKVLVEMEIQTNYQVLVEKLDQEEIDLRHQQLIWKDRVLLVLQVLEKQLTITNSQVLTLEEVVHLSLTMKKRRKLKTYKEMATIKEYQNFQCQWITHYQVLVEEMIAITIVKQVY